MKIFKIQLRASQFVLCASLCVLTSGCIAWSNVSGIKPVYPKTGMIQHPVDSLRPELKWEGGGTAKKYDLAIWNAVVADDSGFPARRKMIYEKTALSNTTHKVEITLEPDSWYYWSVRETGSKKWSTVTLQVIAASGWARETEMFCFWTKKKEKLKTRSKE